MMPIKRLQPLPIPQAVVLDLKGFFVLNGLSVGRQSGIEKRQKNDDGQSVNDQGPAIRYPEDQDAHDQADPGPAR